MCVREFRSSSGTENKCSYRDCLPEGRGVRHLSPRSRSHSLQRRNRSTKQEGENSRVLVELMETNELDEPRVLDGRGPWHQHSHQEEGRRRPRRLSHNRSSPHVPRNGEESSPTPSA
ncbi:unnamed protein product [Gadus morhua 'NCC']